MSDAIKFRLKNILSMMNAQRSGADAHTVGNIRGQCMMLLDALDTIDPAMAVKITLSAESQCADFFKKKFAYL